MLHTATKAFSFDDLEIKGVTDDGTEFSGYASVFSNVDLGGEIVMPGAFTKSLREASTDIPILWNHQKQLPPIGVGSATEDRKGLRVEGVIFNTTLGKDVAIPMKRKAIKGLSIGYTYEKSNVRRTEKGLELHELGLREFSPVNFAMNTEAQIESVKSFDDMMSMMYGIPHALDIVIRPEKFTEEARKKLMKFAEECVKYGAEIQALLAMENPGSLLAPAGDIDAQIVADLLKVVEDRSYRSCCY